MVQWKDRQTSGRLLFSIQRVPSQIQVWPWWRRFLVPLGRPKILSALRADLQLFTGAEVGTVTRA